MYIRGIYEETREYPIMKSQTNLKHIHVRLPRQPALKWRRENRKIAPASYICLYLCYHDVCENNELDFMQQIGRIPIQVFFHQMRERRGRECLEFWWYACTHKMISYKTRVNNCLEADPGPARRARTSRFEHFLGFVFVNFDWITRIYFDFSQYTMSTICI